MQAIDSPLWVFFIPSSFGSWMARMFIPYLCFFQYLAGPIFVVIVNTFPEHVAGYLHQKF